MSEENQNDYDFIEGQENAEEKDRCLVCLDSDPNAKIRGLSAPVPPQSSVPLDEGSTCPISAATYLDGNLLGLLLLSGSLPFVRVVEFVSGETLMRLRMLCKAWRVSVDGLIDSMVSSGEMLVHGGNDIIGEGAANLRTEKRALVLEVVFLLNITKVGEMACWSAINLVVVEIPEGVKRIGYSAFASCVNLTTVAFPKTLLIIEGCAFMNCVSLENVDLLHTNLQFIGPCVFRDCCQLSSMTLPDSLKISNLDGGMKTVAPHVFLGCTAIAPSHIDVFGGNAPYDVKKGQFSDMNPNNIDNKHDATLASSPTSDPYSKQFAPSSAASSPARRPAPPAWRFTTAPLSTRSSTGSRITRKSASPSPTPSA
eukprot:CAMPEP_0182501832 /NCGR_PEP_ID=MMETSP1321-20130603/12163_1 /TAXON_ID=91990 /ORGANISM="Bolidomonas sp., Strain RCC1657" /LENGTH=367 /DNA_ID=CAMNT_0024706583 /DNA_START=102 /DNA_END=1202 /DNA_ORIENTATION=-